LLREDLQSGRCSCPSHHPGECLVQLFVKEQFVVPRNF
jgi:hypothetical protein